MTQATHVKHVGIIDEHQKRAISGLEFVQGLVNGTLPLNPMTTSLTFPRTVSLSFAQTTLEFKISLFERLLRKLAFDIREVTDDAKLIAAFAQREQAPIGLLTGERRLQSDADAATRLV
jgi:hypothetical protein